MKTTKELGVLCSGFQANCECTAFGYYWNFRPGREQELLCDGCRESHLLPFETSRGQIRSGWQKYEHRGVNIDGLGTPQQSDLILVHKPEPVSAFDNDSDEEDEEIEAFIEMESEDAEGGEEGENAEESDESEEGEESEESEESEDDEDDEDDEELPYDGYHGGEEYLDALESQDGLVEGYSHERYIPEDVDTAYEAQDPLWTMFLMSLG